MSATLLHISIRPTRWRAWCEECQDGYQGGKKAAEKWAAKHNSGDRHAA